MPNHIRNRVTLIGETLFVNQLIETFSTHFPKTVRKSFDGDLIFIHKTSGEPGWFNISTGIFKRRGNEDVEIIPEGFEQEYDKEWTRFPDFNKIIPMPKQLEIYSDSWLMPLENEFQQHIPLKGHLDSMRNTLEVRTENKSEIIENFIQGVRNYIDFGSATWHDWSRKNWGTKWNSYECNKISKNVYEFDTAWSGVYDLINKMSVQFPDVKIEYEYSDEDTGSNCGYATFINGKGEFIRLKSHTKEAYDLAFKLRPDNQQNFELVGGNWISKDEEE